MDNKFKIMRKSVKAVMILAAFFMATNIANAQQGPRNGQKQGQFNRQGSNFGHGLDLTEDQLAQTKTMRLAMQKGMLPLRNQLGENDAKLRTLSTAENVNTKEINKLIDSNSAINASMAKLRSANHQQFRKLLTEEQRVVFDTRGHNRSGRGDGRSERNNRGPRKGQGSAGQTKEFK
jgi:Spy/CpxP family protein refolding chaperone